MAEQFDVPFERRKVLEENAKRRLVLRNEFLKETTNPFKHGKGEGGFLFDPALQRYTAVRLSSYNYFRPTPKNIFSGLYLIAPILGYAYLLHYTRSKQEQSFRNGEVAYKDRLFKFI